MNKNNEFLLIFKRIYYIIRIDNFNFKFILYYYNKKIFNYSCFCLELFKKIFSPDFF